MIRKHNPTDCIGMITETHINYSIGNCAGKGHAKNEQPRGLPRGIKWALLFVSDPMVGELNHFKIKIKL